MNIIRHFFRRNKAPAIESKATTLTPEVTLECRDRDLSDVLVTGIACVPNHELITVPSWASMYIFEYSTQGEPTRVFEEHESYVEGVVHLSEDILASVDSDTLLTWRATTGAILGKLQVSKGRCKTVTKASEKEILVGSWMGEVIIITHENGTNLAVRKRFPSENKAYILDISAYNDTFVAVKNTNVQIWNCSSGHLLHSMENENLRSVAVSDDFIVMGGSDLIIHVHEIRDEYNRLKSIDLRNFHNFKLDVSSRWAGIFDISFLNGDIVMVTMEPGGIVFLSLQSGECISQCQLVDSERLLRATVLSDGRICVGGYDGYCSIFKPPEEIEDFITEYSQRMYSSLFATVPFFSPPLKVAFDGIQNGSISMANALELAVHPKFNSHSIQEWTYSHLIVMHAIKTGHLPPSRSYNGDPIYWWNHLYKIASSIEMGEHDWNVVLKFIIEAEGAGILGGGCAKMFEETTSIRSEMNMLSTTIVDLYTRQIAMDEQVRAILHYQKVQQAMTFVNALLACIPFAGGVAGHVLSGGMAILENADGEDFAVSGLVESLFGVGKDWSSFITEPIVKRFIKAGNVVLEDETWNEIPEANRRAVEAAAEVMGLSIDVLRKRLRVAAQEEPAASCAIIIEEVEDGEVKSVTEGNEGSIMLSLDNLRTGTKVERVRRAGGPTRIAEEKNMEGEISELWKVMKTMQQQMKEKIEELEAQKKQQEERIVNMEQAQKRTIMKMELRMKVQDEIIETLMGNLLRK